MTVSIICTREERMWDTTTDIVLAVPPATVTVLTIMGYSVNDAVGFVSLMFGITLLLKQGWEFARWVRRRGWTDWGK